MVAEYVSIKIRRPTLESLKSLAKYGDSIDGVINQCVKAFKERSKK